MWRVSYGHQTVPWSGRKRSCQWLVSCCREDGLLGQENWLVSSLTDAWIERWRLSSQGSSPPN